MERRGGGHPRRQVRLRDRIVVRIGLLVACLSVALGVSTYYLVEDALLDEHDRSTAQQFSTNATALRAGIDDPRVDEMELLASLRPELAARDLLLSDGSWTSASAEVRPDDLPDALVDEVRSGRRTDRRVTIGGQRYAVHGAPLTPDDFYFEVYSLSEVEGTLDTLRTTLVAVGSVATLAGMAIAGWIGRGLAAPLERVGAAAAELADGDLRARLDDHADAEVARISVSFNRMADSLQQRIERESRFAADVSHELRSPLTTLANSMAVLQARRSELSPEAAEAVELMAGDVARFQRLVTDLIEIAKHDAGSLLLELDELPAGAAVASGVRRSGPADLPVTVHESAADALVRVDVQRLDRVFQNVLENAEAYGGGATGVQVEATADQVLVSIDDAGPGVEPDERDRIFERFSRGTHGERRTTADGSGLGLALARENMTRLGGAISVDDAPGGGARFVLSLPRVG